MPHWEKLLDKSLASALAAIEIYNKPDFHYRDEVFVILVVNAWELLTKAKVLKDSGDALNALHAVDHHGEPKASRSGRPLTISLTDAASLADLDPVVFDNLTSLVEIRDAAIHFYDDSHLAYLVYALSTACLKNYQLLVSRWFDRSLLEFRFHVLPLALGYDFETLSQLELEKRDSAVAGIIKAIAERHRQTAHHASEYYFACEIAANIDTARELATGNVDATLSVETTSTDAASVVFRSQRSIDRYPLSYGEVVDRVRRAKPAVTPHDIERVMGNLNVKSDPRYSILNFRTKSHEIKFGQTKTMPKGVTRIYNEDTVRVLVENL